MITPTGDQTGAKFPLLCCTQFNSMLKIEYHGHANLIKAESSLLILLFILLLSCHSNPDSIKQVTKQAITETSANRDYSFIVAGHVYGESGVKNDGVHPPFKEKFPWIRNDTLIQFGVFTGDIVWESTEGNWDGIDRDVMELGIPVHFVAGNHDAGRLFEDRYGKTYAAFTRNKDQFILLDSNRDYCNMDGVQLKMLKNILDTLNPSANIFVFVHHVIWWAKDNLFKDVKIHYGCRDSINFWSVIEPMFKRLPNQTYFFAGDIGGHGQGISYYQDERLHYFASGMGGADDNFLRVDVLKNRSVEVKIILLDDAQQASTSLLDYLPNL